MPGAAVVVAAIDKLNVLADKVHGSIAQRKIGPGGVPTAEAVSAAAVAVPPKRRVRGIQHSSNVSDAVPDPTGPVAMGVSHAGPCARPATEAVPFTDHERIACPVADVAHFDVTVKKENTERVITALLAISRAAVSDIVRQARPPIA